MTPEETKQILDAHTLHEGEGEDHALEEAREKLRQDDELHQWLARRSAEDRQIAAALAGVSPPAELKAKLLALEPQSSARAKAVSRRTWLAAITAAAAAGWLGWLGWSHIHEAPDNLSGWQRDSLTDISQIDSNKLPLDMVSKDDAAIRRYLTSAGSPLPKGLPTPLTDNPRVGCKSLEVAGHRAAIVCFELSPGVLAHLVVLDVGPDKSGALIGKPEFGSHGEWHFASWSDGEKTYLLGTRATMNKLKNLMS